MNDVKNVGEFITSRRYYVITVTVIAKCDCNSKWRHTFTKGPVKINLQIRTRSNVVEQFSEILQLCLWGPEQATFPTGSDTPRF